MTCAGIPALQRWIRDCLGDLMTSNVNRLIGRGVAIRARLPIGAIAEILIGNVGIEGRWRSAIEAMISAVLCVRARGPFARPLAASGEDHEQLVGSRSPPLQGH